MATLPAYITTELRFPADDILCRGDRWQRGCKRADGEAAYAIHTFEGKHFCGYHSPFDNKYVPCVECGEKPALMSTEGDPVCDDCLIAINRVTEYDYYLAMTGAHDLRHPSRPAPANLPASDYVDYHTGEEVGPDRGEGAAGHVCDESEERAAYGKYVSGGLADTDGWYSPIDFESWRALYHLEIGYKEPREAECTETECNAPQRERTRITNTGTRRKPRYESICPPCHKPREAVIVAAQRARRAPQRLSV